MSAVVTDFKGVATGYASQLRSALAAKASTALLQTINGRNASMQRFQTLNALGLLNLSKVPWEPIGLDDCTLLGLLCSATAEMSTAEPVVLVLATGRYYSCRTGKEAFISQIIVNGTQYTEQELKWVPDATSALVTKHRCLTENATVVTVGRNCSLPISCSCGNDQRCNNWYTLHATDVSPSFTNAEVFRGASGSLISAITFSVFSTGASPSLVAVVSNNIEFSGIDSYLASLVSSVNGSVLAMIHNDTNLSAVGNTGVKCGANDTVPGDPSLPTWSSLRSCDSGIRAVGEWLLKNRASQWSSATLNISGVVWDIFPTNLVVMSYYSVIGTPLSVINAAVDASDANASNQLTIVRTQQLSRVAASGAATKEYMSAMGVQNTLATQAMQDSFVKQVEELENISRTALNSSQQRSTTQVQELTESQTTDIETLTSKHLNAMAVATGWTIAVVFAILLIVLLCSAWNTVRVTHDLTNIIGLMEDVAEMKVEDLVVPRKSHVMEVARIETAFQVLVRRLAEYKSYIPAGLFEQERVTDPGELLSDGGSDQHSVSDSGSVRQVSQCLQPAYQPTHPCVLSNSSSDTFPGRQRSSGAGLSPQRPSSARNPKGTRKSVAVVSINVVGFIDVVRQLYDAQSINILNDYVSYVHEAVSQGRGNVDCVLGDQLFATFNAHIPCGDPATAAGAAALEIRSQLLAKVSRLKFQIGGSFGQALASSVGYTKFKTMVTVGSPMKIASMLSHMPRFENGTILLDSSLEERLRYVCNLRPVELVHLPQLKTLAENSHTSLCVSMLLGKTQMQEDEWLYQVGARAPFSDWTDTFDKLVSAKDSQRRESLLQQFLASHPHDEVALRLKDRLALWVSGAGIPL
eukprot:GGOE01030150.1.p1 GENE.GGOE01030150.1~~GGOE01030150.1.p1  ORF type:complete len:996 (-),score=216.26 GGOE01030150.1:294-2885(-)